MPIDALTVKEVYRQSTGTTQYHKLSFMPLLATDGVQELAERAVT